MLRWLARQNSRCVAQVTLRPFLAPSTITLSGAQALCDSFSAGNLTEQLLTDPLIWSSSLILTNVTVTPDPRVHLSSADRHHP
jgi:hypothetical protein